MTQARGPRCLDSIRLEVVLIAVLAMSTVSGGCRRPGSVEALASSAVLRVGVAQLSAANPNQGLRQLRQTLSVESLLRPAEDGRLQPFLADTWNLTPDGASVSLHLRSGVKFHDGSSFNAAAVVETLPGALRNFMGPVFADIEGMRAADDSTVEIQFRRPSPFLLEALEAPIRKPGPASVGTGPYVAAEGSTTEMRANADYYLGRPTIDRIVVSNYPSVRSAWAEMLRDRLDMLYEVGTDALDSIEASTSISTFTSTRPYQYVVALNAKAPSLRSPEIRRALNWAVDRPGIVREALNGHGVASSQPLASRYWALEENAPQFKYDPQSAAEIFGSAPGGAGHTATTLRFTCLVPPDAVNERIALELKRQLQLVGVDMAVEEAPQDQIVQRTTNRQYEAALIEFISGPTLFRTYLLWHSKGPLNWAEFGNATVDGALDRVRHAPSELAYRQAADGLHRAFMDDPPAIFLAWLVRARAVSNRFAVPQAETGRDILSTLRLWKPAIMEGRASSN
jgi:peptide/nickel transport system substrate-binding protein